MILGIGTDIAEIERVEQLFAKSGNTFAEYILSEAERRILAERAGKAEFLAGRWAAKEAFAKALGCGISRDFSFTDIEILPDEKGAPKVHVLDGSAKETVNRLGVKKIHLSISHERKYAVAMTVLED